MLMKAGNNMNKIVLVGGTDSLGVPYKRENKNNIGFYELTKHSLEKKGYQVVDINFFSIGVYNTTDYIDRCIRDNYSLKQIKENQIDGVIQCRKHGIFEYTLLPKKFVKYYKINDNDKNIYIQDSIRNNKCIFLYSAGANDFFAKQKTNLAQMLNPNNLKKVLLESNDVFNECINNIKNNIEYLISLNKDIEIYIISIYIPTKFRYIRKISKEPIEKFNKLLKELSKEYSNVFFVDNSNLTSKEMPLNDWHVNVRGHELMFENINRTIEENSKITKIG